MLSHQNFAAADGPSVRCWLGMELSLPWHEQLEWLACATPLTLRWPSALNGDTFELHHAKRSSQYHVLSASSL